MASQPPRLLHPVEHSKSVLPTSANRSKIVSQGFGVPERVRSRYGKEYDGNGIKHGDTIQSGRAAALMGWQTARGTSVLEWRDCRVGLRNLCCFFCFCSPPGRSAREQFALHQILERILVAKLRYGPFSKRAVFNPGMELGPEACVDGRAKMAR